MVIDFSRKYENINGIIMNAFKTRRLQSPSKAVHSRPQYNNSNNKNNSNSNSNSNFNSHNKPSHHNHNRNSNTKHIKTNHKVNDYYLHARSVVEQLQEQHELGLLNKFVLDRCIVDIVNLLKKCQIQARSMIMLKLLRICKEIEHNPIVKVSDTATSSSKDSTVNRIVLERVSEMLNYLSGTIIKQEDKLCQLIFMERIYQSLVFVIKCLAHINSSNNNSNNNNMEIVKSMEPVFKKFQNVKQKLKKMLSKKQYEMFMVCVSFWALNREIKQQQGKIKGKQNDQQRISNLSKYSETSSQMEARLRKFDETRQNQQFSSQLNLLSLQKKSRNYRKSNSIIIGSNKRVSTTWGRQQSANINLSKEVIRKNQGSVGLSKFTTRKSVSNLGKQDTQMNSIVIDRDSKGAESEIDQNFRPFYFFVVVRDKMRLVSIRKAEIVEETHKMKVYLQGYFCQMLIFHKIHAYFLQNIDPQKLRKFLLAHLKLKQKSIWSVLHAGLKMQSNQNQKKNVIQQLIETDQNQQYKFHSFIKKYNTFFFTKYHSTQNNSKQGTLTVYNNNLQQKLENIKVLNWNIKNNVSFMDYDNQEEQDNNIRVNSNDNCVNKKQQMLARNSRNDFQYDCQKCIVLSDCNFKMKSQKIEIKNIENNPIINKRKYQTTKNMTKITVNNTQKQKNIDIMFITAKKQRKYIIISQQMKNNQKVYSNLKSQINFRNMFSMRVSYSPISSSSSTPTSDSNNHTSYSCYNKTIKPNQKTNKNNNSSMRDDFLCRFYRKSTKQMHCVVNRRMGRPSYVKIQNQISFAKKVLDIGLILCKVLFFHVDQGGLILLEAYIPQIQKYYVFDVPSSLISISSNACKSAAKKSNSPFKLSLINNSSQLTSQNNTSNTPQIKSKAKISSNKPNNNNKYQYLKSNINFHKISHDLSNHQPKSSAEFSIAMVIADCPYIEGKELLYRTCHTNSQNKLQYIDIVTLEKAIPNIAPGPLNLHSSLPLSYTTLSNNNITQMTGMTPSTSSTSHHKSDQFFTVKRCIYKMSNNLRNMIKQQYKIDDWAINKKYGRYCQFINLIKLKLSKIFVGPEQLFNKKSNNYYFCHEIHRNRFIDKISVIDRNNQWKLVHFNQSKKQLTIKTLKINNKTCCNQIKLLREKELKKYLRRFLGDSVLRNTLLKENFIQIKQQTSTISQKSSKSSYGNIILNRTVSAQL